MTKPTIITEQGEHQIRGTVPSKAHIVAVGGGKGGIGKSFVSSNIAIFLSHMGYKTVLIDLDLGGANAHTSLGEPIPKFGLSNFVNGEIDNLTDIAVATRFANLRLISGCNDDLDIANLDVIKRSQLMSAIYRFPADYIVLDLSAGTHQSTVDFFLMARTPIVVFTPDPTSIENAYRFMRACFFRKVKRLEQQFGVKETISQIMSKQEEFGIRQPADLIRAILRESPDKGKLLVDQLLSLNFKIVLNQTRTHKEVEIGHSVKSVSTKFFGMPAEFIGYLEYDNAVWQSLRKRKPLLLEYPHSRLYGQILNLAKGISYPRHFKNVV